MLLKVPSPRCPESPTPQHCTVPSPRSAHVWASPVTTRVAVVRPLTATGTEELVKLPSPLPSCPKLFRPQHCTVPSGSRMHVCNPPAARAVGATVPLAVNCCVWPTLMVGFAGVTVMPCAATSPLGPAQTSIKAAKTAQAFAHLYLWSLCSPSKRVPVIRPPCVTLRDRCGCPHDPGIASGTRAIRLNHEFAIGVFTPLTDVPPGCRYSRFGKSPDRRSGVARRLIPVLPAPHLCLSRCYTRRRNDGHPGGGRRTRRDGGLQPSEGEQSEQPCHLDPARGPRGPRLREGHPLLRPDRRGPRGARDGPDPAAPAA